MNLDVPDLASGARLERASSEIADLQALNQHVIDSLRSGLATSDTQGRLLTFNRAAEAITGLPVATSEARLKLNPIVTYLAVTYRF